MNNSKGFTLIELLVVIAIIGILSTIAMTSLNGARKKAANAAFKSSVASIPGVAILCCDSNSTLADPGTGNQTGTTAICTDTANAEGLYPAGIGTVAVTTNCSAGFKVTVTPPSSGFNGTITSGVCTETGCTYLPAGA